MIEFLNDNIFILFAWRVLQQTAGIHMGVICHPILVDLFLSSDAIYFIQRLLKKNQKELARSFNFTFRYIDDVLSSNNYRFGLDFGQATGKLYHLRLRVACTLFCYLKSRARTYAVLMICLYELLDNLTT